MDVFYLSKLKRSIKRMDNKREKSVKSDEGRCISSREKKKIDYLYEHNKGKLSYYLETACSNGNLALVKYLIEIGIKPSEIHPLKFFLEDVCKHGHKEIAKYLIEMGYPIDGLSVQRMMLGNFYEGTLLVRELLGEKCVCHNCLINMSCMTPCDKVFNR
jgi:hypothetical protein